MSTALVSITVMVKVVVADGVKVDDETLMLAADTAARNHKENGARAENIEAAVLWRDRRVVAKRVGEAAREPAQQAEPIKQGDAGDGHAA